ncbi:hypothetical protein DPMN_102115 [Dreissena polymorpha]|uniref:alkaline phosphatase n=1 Tax=Dreissena polymorpha TaxID=45954 RepID=A0A9D4RAP1_DREPO|nr:hypothetical protein DPMN_102115 [Dreissena polymorpha]
MTKQKDTLIVVTGDHSHAFDIQGYSYRGLDILGLADPLEEYELTLDQKPYTILQYGNGPGYEAPRKNLTGVDTHANNYTFPSAVPVEWETHGGEDVAIYAQGPMAHLFYGVQEQNYIAHVMAYSACIGPYTTSCDHGQPIECTSGCELVSLHIYAFVALLFVSLV